MADAMDIAQRSLPANRAGFGGYSMWYNDMASDVTALSVALEVLYPDQKERQSLVLGLEVQLAMGPNYRPARKDDQGNIVQAERRVRPQRLQHGRDADRWAMGEIEAFGLREAVEAASAERLKAFGFTRLAQMELLVMTKKPSEIAAMRRNRA
jgi:hypothetical protein